MGIFDKQPLDEFYLEHIAKLDKKIAREKARLEKYGNNRLSKSAFNHNIQVFEKERSKLQESLAEYRKQQNSNEIEKK